VQEDLLQVQPFAMSVLYQMYIVLQDLLVLVLQALRLRLQHTQRANNHVD
jgi:hypothetical protein